MGRRPYPRGKSGPHLGRPALQVPDGLSRQGLRLRPGRAGRGGRPHRARRLDIRDLDWPRGAVAPPQVPSTKATTGRPTWRLLIGNKYGSKHYGGFPIEVGYDWKRGANLTEEERAGGLGPDALNIPSWSTWTGDPFYDNYSHVEPGTVGHYSSGGFWRLGLPGPALRGQRPPGAQRTRLGDNERLRSGPLRPSCGDPGPLEGGADPGPAVASAAKTGTTPPWPS